jgi:glycine C-acetyltransferase
MRTPGLDMMQRAEVFAEFTTDVTDQHHLQYKRVALDGSAPVRRIKDPYTNEIRDMIYLASNDYLNLTRHPKVIEAGKRALRSTVPVPGAYRC